MFFSKCFGAHVVISFIESFQFLIQFHLRDQISQKFNVGFHPYSRFSESFDGILSCRSNRSPNSWRLKVKNSCSQSVLKFAFQSCEPLCSCEASLLLKVWAFWGRPFHTHPHYCHLLPINHFDHSATSFSLSLVALFQLVLTVLLALKVRISIHS